MFDSKNLIEWIISAVIYGNVIALSSLGETINEKSGHLNLGVPGIMYLSGYVGYYLVYLLDKSFTNINTGLLYFLLVLVGIFASFITGALLGYIYSLLCVTFKANQNVMGLAISAFGVGFGKFISVMLGKDGVVSNGYSAFNTGIYKLKDLGVFGQLFFSYGCMVYVTIFLIILVAFILFKTKIGLNLRAVGESPSTADAVGINVSKYKYLATMIGCGICGIAGVTYVFTISKGSWSTNNNIESIGWLAVALVIFSSWKPVHLFWGGPLFGFLFWAYTFLPSTFPNLKIFTGFSQVLQMLPYFVTILILIFNSLKKKKENQPPESLGLNYFREDR